MTRRLWGVAAAVVLALLIAVVATAKHDKLPLMVLTSLPLFMSEGFTLDQPGSPVAAALGDSYTVRPIDTSGAQAIGAGRLMMMAQPRAQTPEDLVALDQWVRDGGRLLLFADPRLDWPSELALGDVTRASPMFPDTGLLAHWGVRLDAPDSAGPVQGRIGGETVQLSSPGVLHVSGPSCTGDSELIVRCTIGKGRVIIVADADLLDFDRVGDSSANRRAILGLLGELQ